MVKAMTDEKITSEKCIRCTVHEQMRVICISYIYTFFTTNLAASLTLNYVFWSLASHQVIDGFEIRLMFFPECNIVME